jgi:hypothetical protein
MVAIDALPSESAVADKHTVLLAELNDFNAEAISIARDVQALRPQSEAISKQGELLEKLLAAGPEHLNPKQRAIYVKGVREFEEFVNLHFRPQYDRLQARIAEQSRRERHLKQKARQLGVAVDFHSLSPLSNN